MSPDTQFATVIILITVLGLSDGHLAVMSVDLGSEYMKIAIVKPGVPMEIITDDDSSRKTASIVCLKNEERLFGNPAENCATKYPSQAFWYLTQIVGKKYEDSAVTLYKKRFPYYNLVKDEERGTVLFQVDDKTQYSPEELLAMILEKGRHYAEIFGDQPIKDSVITVPSYFNQAERRAILSAAEMGGLNVLQLMGDNAAVALNYGVFRRKEFNVTMKYIMFYDMGATSTTATIVGYHVVKTKEGTQMVENPQLVIKGVGYDKELGGLEMSIRLRDLFAKYFHGHKKSKQDIFSNHRAMAKLLKEANKVKKVLSANTDIQAQVEGLLEDEDFKMKVTRAEFEDLCKDMIERVTKPIDVALKASKITLAELSDVILVGGGTRIPIVQNKLQEYVGGIELGKSINTDEAAALGAVYQAAYRGKGFKVLNFGVKEANIYPIVVEFEKREDVNGIDQVKKIKQTLFQRMNPYPQKKVMTFNKHYKDFPINIAYSDLDLLPTEETEAFHQLQEQIQRISLKGVEEAYAKHGEDEECKGIKAHFRMDESGLLNLDRVELVFEIEDNTTEEESTLYKQDNTTGGMSNSTEEGKTEPDAQLPNATETESNQGPTTKDSSAAPNMSDSDQSDAMEEKLKQTEEKEKPLGDEISEKSDEEKADETKEELTDEKANDVQNKADKTEEKKGDKKGKTKEETAEKKPRTILVKENITTETILIDVVLPSQSSLTAMRKKLADLTARDISKQQVEKAKNELEAYIYDKSDKLNEDMYIRCSTKEERESIGKHLSEASDWLNEVEDSTPKEQYIKKLQDVKKILQMLEYRIYELKERPQMLEVLNLMINYTQYFMLHIKNVSAAEIDTEDPIFTKVEIDLLEKLINDTKEWKETMITEQKAIPDYETPKLLLKDIKTKLQALDIEVKYLINKAKSYRPKTKLKDAEKMQEKNGNNETVIENENNQDKKLEDIELKGTEKTVEESQNLEPDETISSKPDVDSETPALPTGDEPPTEETLALGGGEDADMTTEQPKEDSTPRMDL